MNERSLYFMLQIQLAPFLSLQKEGTKEDTWTAVPTDPKLESVFQHQDCNSQISD